jgi:hypothetical protein
MKMMTEDDIRDELGWTDSMIHSLLQNPDSPNARRDKFTGGYTYGLCHRDRVLAVAQSTDGQAAKRRWDETLRGNTPNPGWTTLPRRYRTGTRDHGSRSREDDGATRIPLQQACHRQRGSGGMRSPPVGRLHHARLAPGSGRVGHQVGSKRKQEEIEARRRGEEEAMLELRALRVTELAMSLLTAVEYITPHPAHRIALYTGCHAEDQSSGAAKDLAFLERRAKSEGFQV